MLPPPAYSRRSVLQGVFVRPARNILQARGSTGTNRAIQRRPGVEAFPVNLTPKSGGWPLPRDVQAKMESALGANFSDVRIHVGPEASAIGAVAFTWGSDIHFAPGQYNPHTPDGQSLLGHELTHVVQQRAGRVANPFGSGVAVVQDQALEAEADRMGRLAAMHRPPETGAGRSSTQCPTHFGIAVQSKPALVQRHPPIPPHEKQPGQRSAVEHTAMMQRRVPRLVRAEPAATSVQTRAATGLPVYRPGRATAMPAMRMRGLFAGRGRPFVTQGRSQTVAVAAAVPAPYRPSSTIAAKTLVASTAPPVYKPGSARPSPSVAQPTGNPGGSTAPGRPVLLSVQLGGEHMPVTRTALAAHSSSGVRFCAVQRVSVKITTKHADEATAVVKDLVFKNRPPTNKDVQREVEQNNYNKKDGVVWQVGHEIGWDVVADSYRRTFSGLSIQEVSDFFQKELINSDPTIASVERCMGIWIDKHYKTNYEKNEFPQPSDENQSAGGKVPHLKGDYVGEYDKDIRSEGNLDHKEKKRKYIKSQVNWDEGATEEKKTEIYDQFSILWNEQYPKSPLRKDEFG